MQEHFIFGVCMCVPAVNFDISQEYSQFHAEFSRHVPISSEHFPNRNNLTNQKKPPNNVTYI